MQGGWTSVMKVSIIFACVSMSLWGCSKERSIKDLPKESYATEPIYPNKLEYNPQDSRYSGSHYLELYSIRNGFDPIIKTDLPISTFESAFNYAYNTLGEYYTYDLIDSQLPLLIDYQEGIWVVGGALKIHDTKDEVYFSGNAELAFLEETGEILYIFHTL